MIVSPGIKTGLNIRIDNPATLGADLVADCVAALEHYPLPCIIFDMGTATSVSVLNKRRDDRRRADARCTHFAGSVMPKHGTAAQYCAHAATRTIGTNTIDCMASGTLLGTASMVDGMCARIEEELGAPCTVIGTGGMAKDILPLCRRPVIHDENLLLDGLYILYKKISQSKPATTA